MNLLGPRLIIGFQGIDPEESQVKILHSYLKSRHIGGVILFGHNIVDPEQVKDLTNSFREANSTHIPFIALDQEGGKVQRLTSRKGFKETPSAKHIAEAYIPSEAYELYLEMAFSIQQAGFNVNLAPVIDLAYNESDPLRDPCPVIDGLERSYGSKVSTVLEYSQAFIKACHSYNLITSLKHYPGHGFANQDSHLGLVDITETYDDIEEEPFKKLVQQGYSDTIMIAHLMNRQIDPLYPSSLSIPTLKKLRSYYQGVTISDDYNMGAIVQHFELRDIIAQSLKSGIDLLIFSNNKLAHVTETRQDLDKGSAVIENLHEIFQDLKNQKIIEIQDIQTSLERIDILKAKYFKSF